MAISGGIAGLVLLVILIRCSCPTASKTHLPVSDNGFMITQLQPLPCGAPLLSAVAAAPTCTSEVNTVHFDAWPRMIEENLAQTAGRRIRYPADRLLLKFPRKVQPQAVAELLAWHNLVRAETPDALRRLGYLSVSISDGRSPREVLERLSRQRGILLRAEPDFEVAVQEESEPVTAAPWYVAAAEFDRAWAQYEQGASVIVAVVDTGVNRALPELRDACLEGYDVIQDRAGAEDDHGHGTAMAGIIAAAGNGQGFRGLCPGARILPVKALDADGYGLASDVAFALVYAADYGAGVINLSVGCYVLPMVLRDAVDYAVGKGCLVVAAAGNDGADERMYPAAFPNVIAASALAVDGGVWPESNRGAYVDVAAPGERILTLERDGGWVQVSGTSASAAIVSSLAGMLRESRPDWSLASIRQAILATARDLGAPGRDDIFGSGALDAGAAMVAQAAPVHDVALSRAAFEVSALLPGERPVLQAYLRNTGTFVEERADVELWLNGSHLRSQADVAVSRETQVVFELDPFPADAARFEILVRAVPLGEDADSGNNEYAFRGEVKTDAERGMQVLLKDRPFVHSWVAYQGHALLPEGPLKTEMSGYLWGGATYDNLFGDGVRWEEDVDDLDDPSWWSEASGSGACVLEGAYEEDDDEYDIDLGPAADSFMNHFWDPDVGYDYGVEKEIWTGRHHSALWRAHLWWNQARAEYLFNDNKDLAYYCLGRIAHLLADMSTPEHMHNDTHPSDDIPDLLDLKCDLDDISNYEEYTKMVFREFSGSGSPIKIAELPLALPSNYVPAYYDAEFCRLLYNLAQYAQLFDSSDADGNSVGYGDGAIDLGRPAQAGAGRKTFPAIAYVDGRAEPRIDPHTSPTVQWQKVGLSGYYTYKTLPEGPGSPPVSHYVELSRGEGMLGVPSGLWDDLGQLDLFHVNFRYKGVDRSDNILNFDNWPDKDAYVYVPDRLVSEQASVLLPLAMRYTAGLYELFWSRMHPKPLAPATLSATDGAYVDRIVLSWTNVGGEGGYYVFRATSAGGYYYLIATNAANAVTFEHPSTGAATNWYKVTAFNLGGESADSPVDSGYTLPPPPPTPLSVAASNAAYTNQIRVTWADGLYEAGYTIHRADIWDGPYTQIAAVGPSVTQYDDPRPAGGVWFYYKVQAFNGTGTSALSADAAGRTAPSSASYPEWIDASDGTYPQGIMVTWDSVVGASRYLVYRGMSFSGSFSLIHTTAGTETSYLNNLGESSLTYWYYVIAELAAGGNSYWSLKTSGFPGVALPAVPTGVAASDGTYSNLIRVTWSASSGATSYQVFRASSAGGTYGLMGSPTGTSFDQPTLAGGTPWHFKVAALNSVGASALSASDSGYTSTPTPSPPSWLAASDGSYHDRIRVEWEPVTGASGYTLGRAASPGGPFSEFVSVGGATPWFEDEQPAACTPLYYRVVAYVGGLRSSDSMVDSGYTSPAPPPAPANVQASDGTYSDRVRVTWSASAGADGYRIECSVAPGAPYIPRGETAGAALVFDDPQESGLGPFSYRVTAWNAYGESDPGGPDPGHTNSGPPGPPSSVSASDGTHDDRIVISWPAPPHSVDVAVFESTWPTGLFTQVSEWLPADIATSIARAVEDIKGERLYYYRLRSRNVYGESGWSAMDSGWIGKEPPAVSAPVFNPSEGLFTSALDVTVTCPVVGRIEIHYTTNGVTPTLDDPVVPASGVIAVTQPTLLKARAWKTGWFPSAEASGRYGCTGGDPHLLVLGDAQGCVLLITARAGWIVARANPFRSAVASVRVLDADGDGIQDIVAIPAAGADEPAVCLDLLLREKWRSSVVCGLATAGRTGIGAAPQAADVNGDGETEVILVAEPPSTLQVQATVVSGKTGATVIEFDELFAACPRLYFDARSGHYLLAVARIVEGERAIPAAFDLKRREWAWAREDFAIGPCGADSRLLWNDGDYEAALWGGSGGQLWTLAGNGETLWVEACGALSRVAALPAFRLTGPGHPALLVEGAFAEGAGVCVDALSIKDGEHIWTWTDQKAIGFVKVLALADVDDEDDQEVFVLTGGHVNKEVPQQVQGIKGIDRSTLWSRQYDPADHIAPEAKLADVDGDGYLDLLVAANHRIENLNARTGVLNARFEGEGVILSFDLLEGFTDSDGDGQMDWLEVHAGTDPHDPDSCFRAVEFYRIADRFRLGWTGSEGRHYEILETDDLNTGFQVIRNNIRAVPPCTRMDLDPSSSSRGFYRVRIHE